MSKINLLPWREERRKGLNQLFYITVGGVALLIVALIVLIGIYLNYRIGVENADIEYINDVMKNLDAEVIEVKALQENKKQLIERMNIIQLLEIDRASMVRLLDMIPRVLPESVYLVLLSRTEEIKESSKDDNKENAKNKVSASNPLQKSYFISLEGIAATNQGISGLLKNLEAIKWISDLKLNEVSINKEEEGLNFKVEFMQDLIERE